MQSALPVSVHVAIAIGTIIVHEAGHFLAGLLAGLPAGNMKIVLHRYPFHVALRDGDAWRSPVEDAVYAEVAERLIPRTGALFLFVSGGLMVPTVAVAGLVLFHLGIEAVGALIPAMPVAGESSYPPEGVIFWVRSIHDQFI
jgi:hypothetical protein